MKTFKYLLISIVSVVLVWLVFINVLEEFPRDSAIREVADPIVYEISDLIGVKAAKPYDSLEQEKNLAVCIKDPHARPLPEQCQAVANCLTYVDAQLKQNKVIYKSQRIHRLTKMSMGWQMELMYLGAEDGAGSAHFVAHLLCVANNTEVIKIERASVK